MPKLTLNGKTDANSPGPNHSWVVKQALSLQSTAEGMDRWHLVACGLALKLPLPAHRHLALAGPILSLASIRGKTFLRKGLGRECRPTTGRIFGLGRESSKSFLLDSRCGEKAGGLQGGCGLP